MNYIAQFKPIILITKRKYEQQGNDKSLLNKTVRVKEFSDIVGDIEADENFEVWKLKIVKKTTQEQKMDPEAKQKYIGSLNKKIGQREEN